MRTNNGISCKVNQYHVDGNAIDVQFSPHGIYIDNFGIDNDDLCINVPRVVMTADEKDCVGVYV